MSANKYQKRVPLLAAGLLMMALSAYAIGDAPGVKEGEPCKLENNLRRVQDTSLDYSFLQCKSNKWSQFDSATTDVYAFDGTEPSGDKLAKKCDGEPAEFEFTGGGTFQDGVYRWLVGCSEDDKGDFEFWRSGLPAQSRGVPLAGGAELIQ